MKDPELTYQWVIADGQIKAPKRMRAELVQLFGRQDKTVEIEVRIRRKRKRNTDPQRRYYFGVIVHHIAFCLCDADPETGWTPAMVHEMLKSRFLPMVREWSEYVNELTGEAIREPMTTTKLTTVERELYHEHCRKFAAEFFGAEIPLPNEQAEMSFNF